MVALELEGRSVWIRPWLYAVTSPLGNAVPVILLDDQNSPADREITHRLYGDGENYRLRQEAILGIGGLRILQAPNHDSEHAMELYEKLGGAVLPLCYRDRSRWAQMMKETISKIAAYFNSHRTMRRYATEAYR